MAVISLKERIKLIPDLIKLAGLIAVTIFVSYLAPAPFRLVWYILVATIYFYSEDEPLWMAFFLVTTDGFFSFFGLYSVTLTILPGLPKVEISQIYIFLTVIKAAGKKRTPEVFYRRYMQLLFIYMLFNIAWGQMMGLSGELNVYFRVIRGFVPMLLFYSVPRLLINEEMYRQLFRLMFFIVLCAFAAQLVTLFIGRSPMEMTGFGSTGEKAGKADFRVFYSENATLLGLFGALWLISEKKARFSRLALPFTVVFAALAMALLSATRGWIISFSLIIVLAMLLGALSSRVTLRALLVITAVTLFALSNPVIHRQVSFAGQRLDTMEAIFEGDLTARGTLQRLDYRSIRVMEGWRENPLFGWGISDKGYEYGDRHVGNQSLLAMAGVAGFLLLNGFLIWFIYKIVSLYVLSKGRVRDRDILLVIVIFLTGWFIIHSTSGQQFNYTNIPSRIIPQAVFLSFSALQYQKISMLVNEKRI